MLAADRVDHLVVISVGAPGAAGPPSSRPCRGRVPNLFDLPGVAEDLIQRNGLVSSSRHPAEAGARIRNLHRQPVRTRHSYGRAQLVSGQRAVQRLLGPAPPSRRWPPRPWAFGTADVALTEDAMVKSASRVSGPWGTSAWRESAISIPLDAAEQLNKLLLDFLPRR